MAAVHQAIRKALPKLAPLVMSGMDGPLVAYGKFRSKSACNREGDRFIIGLAAGKTDYALPICAGGAGGCLVERNGAKLGEVKTGRSCVHSQKLEDLKLDVATSLVKRAEKSGGINAVA
ncbi:MAG: hypothetical protein HY302_11240 [Opitutae bacterium]|nr:hypothetical protein [Opitutae bacterium]